MMHPDFHLLLRGTAIALLAAITAGLTGCWTRIALDTGANPPPLIMASDRWQLLEQMSEFRAGSGVFDDTAYYLNHYGATSIRLRCPYALTPNPVATQQMYWMIAVPLARGSNLMVACDGGPAQNLSPSWDPAKLERAARLWYQLAHLPEASAGLAGFRQQADAWRALPQPPPLSETARQYKIAAEAAVHDRQWPEAARHYRAALAIDPMWPQGHFNLALLYAELKLFEYAGVEMQKYLLLMPDAANARQAQDKIYEWRAQLSRLQQ